jgi:hypothetical protein
MTPFAARIATRLEVAPEDAHRIVRALGVVFVASFGLGVLKAAQSGLFLASCPRARIPAAFFASAICLATASSLVVAVAPRIGADTLTRMCLGVGGLVIACAHLAITLAIPEAPFSLYVAAEAVSGVLIVQIWSVVSHAIDVRTGKRVLPIAGVVSAVAWASCGLVVPLVSHALGTPSLLALAAALLFAAAWLVVPERTSVRREAPGMLVGLREGFVFLAQDPLARLLTSLAVLSMVLEQTMDFALLSAARDLYRGDAALATFFARFYGATSALSVLTLLGAAGRVLSRLGAVRTLALMPVAVALVAGFGVVLPVFAVVVAYRGVGRVLKQAVWSASTEQLSSPLPATRKTQARQATRGVIAPLGYGIGSLALAALPHHVSPSWLAALTCTLSLLVTSIVLVRVGPRYVDALRRAIDDRTFSLAPPRVFAGRTIERDALAALERDVREGDEDHALTALELLAVVPEPPISSFESGTLHPAAAVRREALHRLADAAPARCVACAGPMAETDPSLEVRLYAIDRLLELSQRGHRMPALAVVADDASRRWAELAGFAGDTTSLSTRLARGIDADDADDALAVRAMLLVREDTAALPGVVGALGRRIASGAASTRLAAAEAVIRAGIVVLIPEVVALLENTAIGPQVAKLIVRLAPRDVTAASPIFDGTLSRLASRITRVADAASVDALVARLLVHPRPSVRQHATRALASAIARKERTPLAPARVRATLETDARRAYHLAHLIAAIDADRFAAVPASTLAAARHEIARTFDYARAELLPIVALLGHAELVSAVEAGRRKPSPARDAQIAELLETSLPESLRAIVVPLFDRLSYGGVVNRGRALGLAPTEDVPLLVALAPIDDPMFVRLVTHVLGENRGDEAMNALFDRLRLLRTVPLFRDLPSDEAFALAERLEELAVPMGGVVFRRDEPGDALYVVAEGSCSMVVEGRVVATFARGEFFGELSLVDGEPRSTDAIAATDAVLLRLRGTDFDEILVHRPDAIRGVVRVLAARLRAATRAERT